MAYMGVDKKLSILNKQEYDSFYGLPKFTKDQRDRGHSMER